MRSANKYRLVLVLHFLLLSALYACTNSDSPGSSEQPIPVRVGWQTTWATQGQIAQTLSHTNALKKNGLDGRFVGVSYGAPLNEAALAGEVDVIFTADQPAAALLASGADWEIIGRLMFNRVAIYVPPASPIQTLSDLQGKTVAMPFGAAAQRVALKAIADSGLDPVSDISSVNLDITEQAGIVERGTAESWGEVDAMAGFDPTVAILETNGSARMLHLGKVTSVIVMSRDYIDRYPEAPERFLRAFREAVLYYANNQEQANEWFRQASQLTFGDEVLGLAASVEPNVQARTIDDVSITFTSELIAGMQEAADFIYDTGLVKNELEITDHINQSYADKVTIELRASDYNPDSVVVTSEE